MLPSSFLVGTDICPKSIQWTNDLQGKFVLRQELWKQWLFSWFCNKLDWLKNRLNLWSFIHNILTRSQSIKCSANFNVFLNNFKSKDWLQLSSGIQASKLLWFIVRNWDATLYLFLVQLFTVCITILTFKTVCP